MIPILLALITLVLSISVLLGLPKAVSLAQTTLSASNVENSQAIEGVSVNNPYPTNKGILPPNVSAAAVYMMDLENGFVYFVKDPDKRVPIASTTKIMTAIVASEYFKTNDILIVPEILVGGSSMGLKPGERLSFRSLLYGMMLNSGNDAAFTIAENYPGGLKGFIQTMNAKAFELGLNNTHFDNPAGFDSLNHFSSATDLAKIASVAASNPQIARVVGTEEMTVFSIDNTITHPLKNLNKMLGKPGVLGMKTGTTPSAKENLVGLFLRGQDRVLTVVLGSNDRFGETEKLLDWVDKNFSN